MLVIMYMESIIVSVEQKNTKLSSWIWLVGK